MKPIIDPDTLSEEQKEAISKKLAELPKVSYEEVQQRLKEAFTPPHPEASISGWVARDRTGALSLYQSYPERQENLGYWRDGLGEFDLSETDFPSLTWQDEPIEVEITIKPKKR